MYYNYSKTLPESINKKQPSFEQFLEALYDNASGYVNRSGISGMSWNLFLDKDGEFFFEESSGIFYMQDQYSVIASVYLDTSEYCILGEYLDQNEITAFQVWGEMFNTFNKHYQNYLQTKQSIILPDQFNLSPSIYDFIDMDDELLDYYMNR